MANPANPQGLSGADFLRGAGVMTIKRNGANNAPDPVRDALRLRNEFLGQKITEQTLAEKTVDVLEAETKQIELEIKKRQLEEQRKTAGGASEWQAYIVGQVDRLQGRLDETGQALAKAQQETTHHQLALLQEELARLRGQASPVAVDPLDQATKSVKSARALIELITPRHSDTPPPVPTVADPALQAWFRRADSDDHRWEIDRSDRHEERMEELRLADERARIDIAQQGQRNQLMERFFTDTVPKLAQMGQGILQVVLQGQPHSPVAAAQAAQDQAQPVVNPAPLLPGVQRMQCERCNSLILFRPEWPGVICPHCGSEYLNAPEPGAGPATEQSSPMGQEQETGVEIDRFTKVLDDERRFSIT